MRTNFENLRVYLLAEQLADEVWKVVRKWEILARDTVGKQLVRAADSIGANIAEGSGRGSDQDYRRFLRIAAVRSVRLNTGCAVRFAVNSWHRAD